MSKKLKKLGFPQCCLIIVFVFLLLVLVYLIYTVCTEPKSTPTKQEFKLLSAHLETRYETNAWGGITDTYQCFCYSYATASGEVLFDEHSMYFSGFLHFELGDENKIIIIKSQSRTDRTFVMTEEMYNQVFSAK